MQSVLVTACSSNGPMLSHITPRYRKPSDSARVNNDVPAKEEFMHNGEKVSSASAYLEMPQPIFFICIKLPHTKWLTFDVDP